LLSCLAFYRELCTGCRRCEAACSFIKAKGFNPSKARLQVQKLEPGIDISVHCIQCGICLHTPCPRGAIRRDNTTGAVIISEEKCDGTGLCVVACPWGMIHLDPVTNKALKCDLCSGKPNCVKYCPTGAIKYVPVTRLPHDKARYAADLVARSQNWPTPFLRGWFT